MIIDNVKISFVGIDDATREEAQNYLDYVRARATVPVSQITITATDDDGFVDVSFTAHGEKFERIRRVTGYLTGDLKSWNNAKQAEERDRVKHS